MVEAPAVYSECLGSAWPPLSADVSQQEPRMADKERERFYIRKLWECLLDPPTGQIVGGESPDFRVYTPEGCLGIEVTHF